MSFDVKFFLLCFASMHSIQLRQSNGWFGRKCLCFSMKNKEIWLHITFLPSCLFFLSFHLDTCANAVFVCQTMDAVRVQKELRKCVFQVICLASMDWPWFVCSISHTHNFRFLVFSLKQKEIFHHSDVFRWEIRVVSLAKLLNICYLNDIWTRKRNAKKKNLSSFVFLFFYSIILSLCFSIVWLYCNEQPIKCLNWLELVSWLKPSND